jgi:SEL1 protein
VYIAQAAEQGHPDAHFYLGVMHLKAGRSLWVLKPLVGSLSLNACARLQGLGVRRKSVQRAFSYFTLAAHAGHVLAMYNTAMLHLAGRGTVR